MVRMRAAFDYRAGGGGMSKVKINCECGGSLTLDATAVYSYIYNYRIECLRCDLCNRLPNIHYGGLEA